MSRPSVTEPCRIHRRSSRVTAFCVATAIYAVAVGTATLCGWYFQIPRLLDWTGAGITQKTNNAIGVIVVGLAVAWLSVRPANRFVPRVLACIAAAIGALTLFQHITQVNLGIDTFLFDEAPGQPATTAPNRMGPIASTWFILTGVAICAITGRPSHRRIATWLGVLSLALTAIPLVGYLYGADLMFTVSRLTGIAFQTTTVFLFLSLAQIALVPEHGLVAALRRNDTGGLVMRRLVLPLTLLPLLLGAVILVGLDATLYDERFAMAALVFTLTVALLSIAAYAMSHVSRATAALAAQQRLYQTVTDNATTALFIMDDKQHCIFMNPAAVEMTGYTLEETRGRPLHDVIHHTRPDGRLYPSSECPIDRALPSRSRIRGEEVFVHKDGWFYHVEFAASPLVAGDDQALCTVVEVADITERKAAEAALQEMDRRKDIFFATLAHELRNPLTAIHHGVQLLRNGDGLPPDKQDVVAVLADQVGHLVHLIDDLLDISRITRGKITLRRGEIDPATAVRRALDAAEVLMRSHHHTLTVELPESPITVNADATRLVQIIINLLNNAAKFTNDGGRVLVKVERENGQAVIRVRDNGRGIAPDALDNIFYQTDHNLDRSTGGLGIGLALVKNLVELHGGRVEAHSDGPGHGSEFVVRLPCA